MVEVVSGATWTILAPASWCWPSPAKAMERTSPWAPGSMSQTAGYFMVRRLPRLPSTHSMVALRYATARLVTRVKTLFDQFWMVVYRQRPFSLTMILTTAAWRESVGEAGVGTGAEQPST